MNLKKWLLLTLLVFVGLRKDKLPAQAPDTYSALKSREHNVGIHLADGNLNIGTSTLAPFRYADKLYFTALMPKGNNELGTYTRLYTAMLNGTAQPMPINPQDENMHAAHATLNVTATRIYYTLFEQSNLSIPGQSEICYREKQYDGTWGNIVKLPKHVNKTNTFNSQPACGYDAILKKDVVFFVSNREGGKGGFDIWYCTVERNGEFGDPINLPTNTPADEMTPFFLSKEQILFFSSNKRGGSGGMDVYAAQKMADSIWQPPTNLKSVNTPFDELYFSYHQPSKTCYFSSNRPNASCSDQPKGCRNYSLFTGQLGQTLVLQTLNQASQSELFGCTVQLRNLDTGKIESVVENGEDSKFFLTLFSGYHYRLIVSRPGYQPTVLDFSPSEANIHLPVFRELALTPSIGQ